MEEIPHIEKTKNYQMFHLLKGNRPIKLERVKKYEKIIKSDNFLRKSPIIINEFNEIINGQHREKAAENVGEWIYYIQIPGLTLQDAIEMQNDLHWKMENFIQSNIELGKADYLTLKTFYDTYGVPPKIALSIIKGTSNDNEDITKVMKSGDLTISLEEIQKATTLITELKKWEPLLQPGMWKTMPFIRAHKRIYGYRKLTSDFFQRVEEYCLADPKNRISKSITITPIIQAIQNAYNSSVGGRRARHLNFPI